MATEQGTRQAREVGELMTSTATMLEDSLLAAQQQKSAADQVDTAILQIRHGADQLAAAPWPSAPPPPNGWTRWSTRSRQRSSEGNAETAAPGGSLRPGG